MINKRQFIRLRATFPQVYQYSKGYMVSARSKKFGLNKRRNFPTEKQAMDFARDLEKSLIQNGKQPEIPKDKLQVLDLHEKLTDKLQPFGRTVEEAVNFYHEFLGQEALKNAKPFIRDLVEDWKQFKKADTTLSNRYTVELKNYARFIKRNWGAMKPDEPTKNQIDLLIKGLNVKNNSRRKYLRLVRMFFNWLKDEGHIAKNPTDGIFYKPDDFNAAFYSPEQTATLLRYIVDHEEKDLIGYYALLTFAGLRPSEGTRVQWQDFNSKTNELYVRKGKTNARHIILEPVAVEWVKLHEEKSVGDAPFVEVKNLANREKVIRKAVFNGQWVQDGLRHGFGTYYKAKIQNLPAVAEYMGNSVGIVKKHYARTIAADEWKAFWDLTPTKILATPIPAPA